MPEKNKQNEGNEAFRALHPTIFVIFGITGDLASRKLLPALLGLYSKKMLPERFVIVGFSRRPFSRQEFREYTRSRLNIKPGEYKEEVVKHFFDHISYEQGLFDDLDAYQRLEKSLKSIDERWGQCSNKLFHLSVPPTLYEGILTNLSKSGVAVSCADETGWTRILIEKPFGSDIKMAYALDKLLGKLFKEEQIFRIDHYLAKEAAQNILAFRFANSMFEPLWCNEYIDSVHIKLFEKLDIEGRGAFFDPIGALRDMGQSHMLAMLSLVAMDEPKSFSGADVRRERALLLTKLAPIGKKDIADRVTRAQYSSYTKEPGVNPKSETETYFRVEARVNSSRWKGVPFYLEYGKAWSDTKTEIDVYFKEGHFNGDMNILTFRIQPDEGIKIKFFVKTPGYEFKVEPKTLKFRYSDVSAFVIVPNAYEKLIHDAFVGDQTLFPSTEEIIASWKYVTPILENLSSIHLKRYEKGASEIE